MSNLKKKPVFLAYQVLAIFLALWLVQAFAFKVYFVPSASMEPTLLSSAAIQDRILVNKLSAINGTSDGQIMLFRKPATWMPAPQRATFTNPSVLRLASDFFGVGKGVGNTLVKRVVAVGGDKVSCCNIHGQILVNGKPAASPPINYPFSPKSLDCNSVPTSQRCFPSFVVPKDHVFVLGDNRPNSADSLQKCRLPGGQYPKCVLFVPNHNLIGAVTAIVYPLNRWRWF